MRCIGCKKETRTSRKSRCSTCYQRWKYNTDPAFRARKIKNAVNWYAAHPEARKREWAKLRDARAAKKGDVLWNATKSAYKYGLPPDLVLDLYRQGCVDCGADRRLIVAALRRHPDSGLRCRACLLVWERAQQLAQGNAVVKISGRRTKTPVKVGEWLESRRRDRAVALSARNVLLDVSVELRANRTG